MGAAMEVLLARARQSGKSANHQLMDALLAAMEEACRLANEGHVIVGLDISAGRPTIQLERSAVLAHYVEVGKASYTTHGIDRNGQRRRVGELLGRGVCRVTWMEVGH